VFPACAGVIPHIVIYIIVMISVPRMRGGDPQEIAVFNDPLECSPHARG